MTTDGIVLFGALFAGLGVLLIYATLTAPEKIRRAQTLGPRYEVKLARSVPGGSSLSAMAMDLGDVLARLLGADTDNESTARGQAIVQLLKAADWYWELRVDDKPTPDAPFWNLPTYWSAKGAYTLLYAAIGLAFGSFVSLSLGVVWTAPVAALVMAWLGFVEPDNMLTRAAKVRQDAMTIELGFSAPKLHSIVRGDTSLMDGLRNLTGEPGGPFIEEMARALIIYGVAKNLSAGLNEMIARNTNPMVREFCTSMKMAVERMGGNLGEALERQSQRARHEMRRYVAKRSEQNRRTASTQAITFATLLTFLLFIIPIAMIVAQALTGGSF